MHYNRVGMAIRLTKRQQAVLDLLGSGFSQREVAVKLKIQEAEIGEVWNEVAMRIQTSEASTPADYLLVSTYERLERPHLVVVKKGGVRELFDRNKVLAGIERASEKTTISAVKREEMVARIEQALYDLGKPEVSAKQIGELVMDELAKADEVAYVRFASVYRHFTSIKSFEEGLSALKARKQEP